MLCHSEQGQPRKGDFGLSIDIEFMFHVFSEMYIVVNLVIIRNKSSIRWDVCVVLI